MKRQQLEALGALIGTAGHGAHWIQIDGSRHSSGRNGAQPSRILQSCSGQHTAAGKRAEKNPDTCSGKHGQRLCVIAIITDSLRKVNTKHIRKVMCYGNATLVQDAFMDD